MFAECRDVGVSHEQAEILAVRALGYLAEHRERMEDFIQLTGVAVGDLRDHASDQDYLGAVLDFLLADERALLEFTARVGVAPECLLPRDGGWKVIRPSGSDRIRLPQSARR